MEQILDIAQREREPNVHHHGKLDDFGRGFEITEGRSGHRETVGQGRSIFKQSSFDTTIAAAVERALRGRGDLEIHRRWLSPSEAANYLGCTKQHLQMMRMRRSGPSFVKLGRLVRYARTDLDEYLNARKITTKI